MALRYERDGECWCQRRPSVVKAYFDHRLLQEFLSLYDDIVQEVLALGLDVGFPDLIIYCVCPPFVCWLVEVKSLTDLRKKTQGEFHRRIVQTRVYKQRRASEVFLHGPGLARLGTTPNRHCAGARPEADASCRGPRKAVTVD